VKGCFGHLFIGRVLRGQEVMGERNVANDASFTRHSSQGHTDFCSVRTPTSSPPPPVYSPHIFSSIPWLLSLSKQPEIRIA